jgi:hypothetical protein
MEQKRRQPTPGTVWAYGYEIAPPLAEDRLHMIKAVLDSEHSNAMLDARTWEGRFVVEEQVTHILVVSNSPDQDLEVNRRLEAELKKLDARFSITSPLAVVQPAGRPPSARPPSGSPS